MSEKFDAVVARQTQNGDVVVEGGFEGNLRMMGSTNLSEGQIVMVPTDYKVYKNSQLSNNERTVMYTIAQLLDENKNIVGGVVVYPSAWNRTVFVYEKNEDGTLRGTGRTETPTGQPVVDFNAKTTVTEAMDAIAGKPMRVVSSKDVPTRDFNDKTKMTTQKVFSFEYLA